VVVADGRAPRVALNDRLGRFHAVDLEGLDTSGPVSGLLVTDLDKDGHADLVALSPSGRVAAWRNTTTGRSNSPAIRGERWPIDARGWRTASSFDLDLDTWPDLVGASAAGDAPAPWW